MTFQGLPGTPPPPYRLEGLSLQTPIMKELVRSALPSAEDGCHIVAPPSAYLLGSLQALGRRIPRATLLPSQGECFLLHPCWPISVPLLQFWLIPFPTRVWGWLPDLRGSQLTPGMASVQGFVPQILPPSLGCWRGTHFCSGPCVSSGERAPYKGVLVTFHTSSPPHLRDPRATGSTQSGPYPGWHPARK